MDRRLLCVGRCPANEMLVEKAVAQGIDVVFAPDAPSPEALRGMACSCRPDGILAVSEEYEAMAAKAAAVLGLAGPGTTWTEPDAKEKLLSAVAAAGVPTSRFFSPKEGASRQRDMESLGIPLWVESGRAFGRACRFRVDHAADLPLVLNKARKQAPGSPVLLRCAVDGPLFRMIGFHVGREYVPVEVIEVGILDGFYAVPMTVTLPPGCSGRAYQQIVGLAAQAGRVLPTGHYLAEIEFGIVGDTGVLTGIQRLTAVEPVSRQILQLALGIDLDSDFLRVASGLPPCQTPRRALAVAARWLTSHSGHVESIAGIDAARALAGVQEVCVATRVGDTLRHVTCLESRDRVGYVIASGGRREDAQARADAACVRIQITTQPVVL